MNNIETIVFDVGNVLLDWNPRELYRTLFGEDGYLTHPLKDIVGGDVWLDMDRGASVAECLEALAPDYREELTRIERFFRGVGEVIQPLKGSFECVEECKARGYRLLLLSNFGREPWHQVRSRFAGFDMFDGGVISWEVRLLKPDRRIYEALLAKYDLLPEKTLFIDDTAVNVEAAQKLGIGGLYLPREKSLKEELFSLLERGSGTA